MGLFSNLFGGDKRVKVIREIIAMIAEIEGISEKEIASNLSSLTDNQALASTIGSIVVNIDTISKSQESGTPMLSILKHIENHRRKLGHNATQFDEVLGLCQSNPGAAAMQFLHYRHNIENPGTLSDEQFAAVFEYAFRKIHYLGASWPKSSGQPKPQPQPQKIKPKPSGEADDDADAVEWYRSAAEQGDAGASYILAKIYDEGKGAAENPAEAVKWY